MKKCTQCGAEKELSEFIKAADCVAGRRGMCKICTRQNSVNLRAARPEHTLLVDARSRAKKRGLPFNIELSDVVIPPHCPALGIPLVRNTGGAGWRSGSPSLDRIIPELGYVKGNVIVVSWRTNQIKNNATVHELIRIAEFYSKLVLQSPNGGS